MTASAIRDRLYDYIRVADDKKIKAIYTMLEGEIDEKVEWWKDNQLVKEFEADYQSWKEGKSKGYTSKEVHDHIEKLRAKRKKK